MNRRICLLLVLVVGILLMLVSNGNITVPVAAWLAPVFLIRFTRQTSPLLGLPVLFCLIALSTFAMLYGIIPPFLGVLTYILLLYYAVLTFLPYLIDRLVHPAGGGFAATLIFPAAVVLVEYLSGLFYGTWNSVAYTQVDSLALLQLSSLTGLWGITFAVSWLAPVVNWCIEEEMAWRRVSAGVLCFVAVLAAVLLFGGVRLSLHEFGETTKVAAVFRNPGSEDYRKALEERGAESLFDLAASDPQHAADIVAKNQQSLFEFTERLARSGQRVILWAEAITAVSDAGEEAFIERGAAIVRKHGVYLAMSFYVFPPDFPASAGLNKTVLLDPKGNVAWDYRKSKPVPGAREDPGEGIIPEEQTPFGSLGTAICYDMDFPYLIHQAGAKGIDLMLVPGWDWRAIDPLHTRMALVRAVENGFNLLRAAGEGLSLAVDPTGRAWASGDYFASADHVMIAEMPTEGVWTLYSALGDYFPMLCLAGLLLLVLLRAVRGLRGLLAKH